LKCKVTKIKKISIFIAIKIDDDQKFNCLNKESIYVSITDLYIDLNRFPVYSNMMHK